MTGLINDGHPSTRQVGSEMEEMACRYLMSKGYRIEDRNFHGGRFAELDIVARDPEGYLCFVEVKYRASGLHGGSEGAVDSGKIKSICRCASYYMSHRKLSMDIPVRFDVVFIVGKKIQLLQNAFDYVW